MTLSIIFVLFVCTTFFFDFKYDPGVMMKLTLIWAFTFLGFQSYFWIRNLKRKESKKR